MTKILAIELENFQSIEQRTRIEFKPLTLLFGPNSAGKSAVFDALELMTTLLDPTKFEEARASNMVDRWARRRGDVPFRDTFLAIEFPFEFEELSDVWGEETNWPATIHRTESAGFYLDPVDDIEYNDLQGVAVRIEFELKVSNRRNSVACRLSECRLFIKDRLILSLAKTHPTLFDEEELAYNSGTDDEGWRWLSIYDVYSCIDSSLLSDLNQMKQVKNRDLVWEKDESGERVQTRVRSSSLSPLNLVADAMLDRYDLNDSSNRICKNAAEIMFYFGTILTKSTRGQPGIVTSDRRAPKPNEALAVVDLGLQGWWSRTSFSPSSPAALLKSFTRELDEHYQGLAEIAHADLLLRTAHADFWGDTHAAKYIEAVRDKSRQLEIVNHHLETSLFSEKLYRLTCAATLMVPVDLSEDDPWSYYALAQPAAVRLFLRDGESQNVDFQDVGSGIPFVLPILYVLASQGFVKVQQPELHLHPALQSSLADVFIEELNRSGSGQYLIETHSEHLLLRLLRRIRDSESNKCLSDALRVTNEDIAVYYFDPQVTGGTVVSRQLVTPLGDFYTEWPRGFFAERNRDLFDE